MKNVKQRGGGAKGFQEEVIFEQLTEGAEVGAEGRNHKGREQQPPSLMWGGGGGQVEYGPLC